MRFKDYFGEEYLRESFEFKDIFSGRSVDRMDLTLDYVGKGVDQEGPGLYFSSDIKDALSYGKYIIVVNLSMNKLLSDKKKPLRRDIEELIRKSPLTLPSPKGKGILKSSRNILSALQIPYPKQPSEAFSVYHLSI